MIFPPYSLQTKLITIAALCAAFFWAGWTVHGWKTDASLTRSIAKAEITRQSTEKKQAEIVKSSDSDLSQTKIVYRTIRERINDQNDQRICFADNAALQLWNDAITGTNQHRSEPTAAPSETGTTQGDNNQTVATVERVLNNAAENFQICNESAIRHNALIDVVESLQGKMCYCGK